LCSGWVRTVIADADRNGPARLGGSLARGLAREVMRPHIERAIDQRIRSAAVADLVVDAIVARRFWIPSDPEFVELAVRRWQRIAEASDPDTAVDVHGFPPATAIGHELQHWWRHRCARRQVSPGGTPDRRKVLHGPQHPGRGAGALKGDTREVLRGAALLLRELRLGRPTPSTRGLGPRSLERAWRSRLIAQYGSVGGVC